MALVTKTSEKGNTITFKKYNGRTFLPITVGDVGSQLKKISSFRCRPDGVLLCSFPKSGTHWLFNMVRMIQTRTTEYSGTPDTLEFRDIGELGELKSPRILHTHLSYPFIPKAAMEGKLKIIYILRNPKDVACSYFKFMSRFQTPTYVGNFDGFLKAFSSEESVGSGGSWFTHTVEWNTAMIHNPNLKILFLRFENLKKNHYKTIVQIADFLEVDHEEIYLRKVEDAVAFENLKKQHSSIPWWENETFKHQGDNERLPIYRKGMIGDWKNIFTGEQNERFDNDYKEKISNKGVNLHFVYE